jgi:glycerophosphoryl diester phosphodiesterase
MKIPNNKIAHRGIFDNIKVPENSIASFKKTLKYNYSIELDIQLTKDNMVIVFHDENLKRMTGLDKLVKDTYYEEIKTLHLLNTKEYIPTLDEVLDLIDNKVLLDIEIKDTKKIKEITNILKDKLSNYNNYVLKSFNPKIVRYLKKNTDAEVGYLISDKKKILSNYFIIKYTKADFLSISKKLLRTKKFKKLKNKYQLLIWTIKDKDEIKDENIIYICNDLPY